MEYSKEKYERAKKRVADEKGFYNHLTVYLVINTLLQLFYSGIFFDLHIGEYAPWWVRFTTPFFWGLSLFIHWIYVFKGFRFLKGIRKWEERKIKEFMQEEKEEFSSRFREK
ncbi:2TM domain-containing protein [Dokdonia donghaensis]|uniref:2TM domain-containing protein n=1 Tax=Dokdonia donghaensis TaxID=326320 RepID=UPI0035C87A26